MYRAPDRIDIRAVIEHLKGKGRFDRSAVAGFDCPPPRV